MTIIRILALATLLLAACRPSSPMPENSIEPVVPPDIAAATNSIATASPPAAEPAIDETGAAAAARIVERYGDLIEERRFAEARTLWGGNAPGEAELAAAFDRYATIDAKAGAPGQMEGAAGSIYVEVPLTLSGTLKSGGRYGISGPVTLRRVNDVPGSTVGQRRWHIYAADLKPVR